MNLNVLHWLMPFRDLDHEQQNVVNNIGKPGVTLVHGPAGSGKTAIALYTAKLLQDQRKSYRLFVYTNVLQNFIVAGARVLGLPLENITTFHSWVWNQYRNHIGPPPDTGDDKFSLWVDGLVRLWSGNSQRRDTFEYVIVDEAQDFQANVAKLIRLVSRNILVIADPVQSLYVDTENLTDLTMRWGPIAHQFEVPRNYRNTMAVARVAASFADGFGLNSADFLKRVKGKPFDQKPIWYSVESLDAQSQMIKDIILQARGSTRIGILCRHKEQIRSETARLNALGQQVQIALSKQGYNFDNPLPMLTTIHSAKGLEFDWVILPYLNQEDWEHDPGDPKERRLFFVALTRAKERLYLISKAGRECAFLQEIVSKDGNMLQRPLAQATHATPATATSNVRTDDFDDPF